MIESLRFTNGYPVKLPGIKKKELSFSGRLNLVIGPNGGGKSTVLGTLAKLTGCGDGGWSSRGWSSQTAIESPPATAEMRWDGLPVFYQDCYTDSASSFINPGFFDEFSHLRSTGEKRIGLINELISAFEIKFPTYRLKIDDRPTLLLDEVDNHIGFVGQSVFWKDVIPRLIKKYQIIVSTHSVFPLLLRKDTSLRQDRVIELDKEYVAACVKELADAVDRFNKGSISTS